MREQLIRLFWISRPVSWVNTAYPFAAGYLLGGGGFDWLLFVGTVFFLIPYNLLMYGVNDVFDYASDVQNPRKGGVEGASVAKAHHRSVLVAAGSITAPFVLILLLLGTTLANLCLLVVLFFVLAYSVPYLRFKERPLLDSITSSIHFVGPLLYGLVATGFDSAATVVLIAFFLWGMASHAFGAVQDIIPDRQGGIHSIATVLGARLTVCLAFALYCVAGIVLFYYPMPTPLLCGVALLYALNVAPFLSVSDADSGRSNSAWRHFIVLNLFAGFCITMLLLYLVRQ